MYLMKNKRLLHASACWLINMWLGSRNTLVRETSLFITTCHSILEEDNILTLSCGRSPKLLLRHITWSDMFFFFFFFWEGIRSMSLKEKMISPMLPEVCSLCLKKYLQPLQQEGLRLQACLIPWTQCRLHGKPSKTTPSAYESGGALSPDSRFPLTQSCHSAWAGEVRDMVLLEMSLLFTCLHSDLAFLSGAETSVW